jgi:hypothetical protein
LPRFGDSITRTGLDAAANAIAEEIREFVARRESEIKGPGAGN